MGIVAGGSNNQIIIAESNLEIYSSNINGATKAIKNIVPVDSENPGDYVIQNMVKDPSGTVYALCMVITMKILTWPKWISLMIS